MAGTTPNIYYTFDDVLIRPGKSGMEPREARLTSTILPGITLEVPILSAAMDRVTDATMAVAVAKAGGIGVLHRNCTIHEEVAMAKMVKKVGERVLAGCGPFDIERAQALAGVGVDGLVIDCAHGHNQKVMRSVQEIKRILKHIPLIVGNIATKEAARDLAQFADAIKVGVGPGSICSTRVVSGVGVPQLSALMEVVRAVRAHKTPVIADGGIRTSGDMAKALAAGASAVMLGGMLAGASEAPGKKVRKNGLLVKEYRGMGSRAVLESGGSQDRYLTKGRAIVPEGVEAYVPVTGPVANTIAELAGGVQVAMGYVGARTLSEFHRKARFIPISHASVVESRPHSVLTV